MEFIDGELHLSDYHNDIRVAALAFVAHSPMHSTMPLDSIRHEGVIEERAADKVLEGLGKISLGRYGHCYHGLSRNEADNIIGELSGDVQEFFDPILARAIQ